MARKRKDAEQVPSFDKLMIPVLTALIDLGGSGTKEFSLGVKTKIVEEVEIDENFFDKF